jgi:hypothetical protein
MIFGVFWTFLFPFKTIISGHIDEAHTLPHYYLSLCVGDI